MLIMKTENKILSEVDYDVATRFLVAMWRIGVCTPKSTFQGKCPDDMIEDITQLVYRKVSWL